MILLKIGPCLSNDEWPKHAHTTMSERRCFTTSFLCQIWHFLVTKLSMQFLTCHIFMDDSSYNCISTNYPNTIFSQVIWSQPPSTMTYRFMTHNNYCLCNVASLWQNNWMWFINGQFGSYWVYHQPTIHHYCQERDLVWKSCLIHSLH